MRFVIKGDKSARHDVSSLCSTCDNAWIVKGMARSEVMVQCHAHYGATTTVRWHVTECTSYFERSAVSLRDMEKIAYRFSVDDRRNKMGFMSASQWKIKHPTGGPGDDYLDEL
jgi:hypothetical protein